MKCPLCKSKPTSFIHPLSGNITLPFIDQICSNNGCGLPCQLWDKIAQLQAVNKQQKIEIDFLRYRS